MPGGCYFNDEIAYLVGCGLEIYGCVLTDTIRQGQPMTIDDKADLGLVLSGALRAAWRSGFATELFGPTVLLRSDICNTQAVATRDLRMLSMTYGTCATLVARDRAFRRLYFVAVTARIRALSGTKAKLTVVH